jgi:hypothetical protein
MHSGNICCVLTNHALPVLRVSWILATGVGVYSQVVLTPLDIWPCDRKDLLGGIRRYWNRLGSWFGEIMKQYVNGH